MWIAIILAVLATVVTGISIWKFDDTKTGKVIGSILLCLALIFTLISLYKSNEETIRAKREQKQKSSLDSVRFENDSLKNLEKNKNDFIVHNLIDSNYMLQIKLYQDEISNSESVNKIKQRVTSLIGNLDATNSLLDLRTHELTSMSRRLLYPLQDNINMNFLFQFKSKIAHKEIEKYLATHSQEDFPLLEYFK